MSKSEQGPLSGKWRGKRKLLCRMDEGGCGEDQDCMFMGTIKEVDALGGWTMHSTRGGSRAGLDACSHQAAARRSRQSLPKSAAALGQAASRPLSTMRRVIGTHGPSVAAMTSGTRSGVADEQLLAR